MTPQSTSLCCIWNSLGPPSSKPATHPSTLTLPTCPLPWIAQESLAGIYKGQCITGCKINDFVWLLGLQQEQPPFQLEGWQWGVILSDDRGFDGGRELQTYLTFKLELWGGCTCAIEGDEMMTEKVDRQQGAKKTQQMAREMRWVVDWKGKVVGRGLQLWQHIWQHGGSNERIKSQEVEHAGESTINVSVQLYAHPKHIMISLAIPYHLVPTCTGSFRV